MNPAPCFPFLMLALAALCAVAGSALALSVSAVALAGSAVFPLVIRRLIAKDRRADQ